jgi:hypothetical protein
MRGISSPSEPSADFYVRVTMSLDDGPPRPVEFSHPPVGTSVLRHLVTAMHHTFAAEPAETVHFHAGEGQPEVCFDADCTIPRLDVS